MMKTFIVRYSIVNVLLLSFQVQHSTHNLFEQIKIITRMLESVRQKLSWKTNEVLYMQRIKRCNTKTE